MMNKIVFTLLILSLTVGVSACSTSVKYGSSGLSQEELFEDLESFATASISGVNSGRTLFNQLLENNDTVIYYARSGDSESGGVGPAYSVVSMGDFSQFGPGQEDVAALDLESSRVALLDGFDSSGARRFVLAVQYQVAGEGLVSATFEDKGYRDSKEKLQIEFTGHRGNFVLETHDIYPKSKELKPWIHLKMIEFSEAGRKLLGQFSALEGFES